MACIKFILLIALCKAVLGLLQDTVGYLAPYSDLPVSNSVTNALEFATYTFKFIPSTDIPKGGVVEIEFPSTFEIGLGVQDTIQCGENECSLEGRTVTVTLNSGGGAGSIVEVSVGSVRNPSTLGGTGVFKLTSWIGEYVLDQNLAFGAVGIDKEPGELSSCNVNIETDGSLKAGEATNYEFSFTVNSLLPAGSWIRIIFPEDDIIIPIIPTCISIPVNGIQLEGKLLCRQSGNILTINRFTNSIPSQTDIKISIAVTNPPKSLITGSFYIQTGRYQTNTIYEKSPSIPGLTISPGSITSVSLYPIDFETVQSRSKLSLYTLSFNTFNTIPEGGEIWVYFNNNFNMDNSVIYRHQAGLTDISTHAEITLSYDQGNNILVVTNFKEVEAVEVSLLIQITNSASRGATLPLIIRTFDSDGSTIIDENITDAVGYIDYYSSLGITALFNNDLDETVLADGSILDITFTIVPNVEIPINGYLTFKIPEEFLIVPGSLVADVDTPARDSEDANIELITGTRKLKVEIPSGYQAFKVNINNKIRITAGLSAPEVAGYYVIDVNSYDGQDVLLESNTIGIRFDIDTSSIDTFEIKPLHVLSMYDNAFGVKIENKFDLPSGAVGNNLADQRAYIDIDIPVVTNLFDSDLGYDYEIYDYLTCIPESNIESVLTSGQLTCQIINLGNTITIRVTDFNPILQDTEFSFFIASIKYSPSNAPTFTVNIYTKENWVETLLGSSSYTGLAADTSDTPTQSSAVTFTLSSTEVSSATSLSIVHNTDGQTLNMNTDVLIIFETNSEGYCKDSDITCQAGGSNVSCICFTGLNMILMKPTANIDLTTTTIQISSLTNPSYVSSPGDDVRIISWDGADTNIDSFGYANSLPVQTAGMLYESQITADKLNKGSVDVTYTISFRTNHAIDAGGYIKIRFPDSYSLSSSSPQPYCIYLNIDSRDNLSCNIDGNSVIISDIEYLEQSMPIILKVRGVKNPTVSTSGNFQITTYNKDDRVIDTKTNVAGLTFTDSFTSGTVTFEYVKAFPSNMRMFAEFELRFVLEQNLPAGGIISVNLPNSMINGISSSPTCRISGSGRQLQPCTTSGQNVIITTLTDLPSLTSISLFIDGGYIFSSSTSQAFTLITRYDGQVLDNISSEDLQNRIFTPASEPSTLLVDDIDFYPQNSGEVATYVFSITPVNSFTSSDDVIIIFPDQYNRQLGDSIECWSEGLSIYAKCEVKYGRVLRVYNHNGFSACEDCSLKIYVYGVVNPSVESTDEFTIGIMNNNKYSEVNISAGTLSFDAPPSLVSVWNILAENEDSTLENNFYFSFTTSTKLPSSAFGGEIWFVYSSDYDISTSNLQCTSDSIWASGYPTCSISQNYITASGSSSEFTGDLSLTLLYVSNPVYEVTTPPITIKTYDRLNKIILDSSYTNLSPFPLSYSYPGPVIHINNDTPITLEIGTVSPYIQITVDEPCGLSLTLIPESDELYFLPSSVSLSRGKLSTSFQVGAPSGLESIESYITWTILGDIESGYYTPIKKTKVKLVKTNNVGILVNGGSDVPTGGFSLPITITLEYAPNSDITLELTLSENAQELTVPASITFLTGELEKTFMIDGLNSVLIPVEPCSLSFSVLGTDKDTFLTPNTLEFNIVGSEDTLPIIRTGVVINILKTSANIKLITNTQGILYYAIQLANSEKLEFETIKNQVPSAYSSTRTSYGSFIIDSSLALNEIIDGLEARTSYTLTCYLESKGRLVSDSASFDFTTQSLNRPVAFTMRFQQYFMTAADKAKVIESISIVLGVEEWQLVENVSIDIQRGRRLTNYASDLNLYLSDNPYSDILKKPLRLINSLDSKKDKLATLIPTLDTSYSISGREIIMNSCRFINQPEVQDNGVYNSISILSSLKESGYIYAVLIKSDQTSSTPTSLQIASSLTDINHPALGLSSQALPNTVTNITFTGLSALTEYDIYLTCGNNLPGSPELLPNDDVLSINWRTAAVPAPKALNLDSAALLSYTLALAIILLAI